jgi:hypothetical protein
MNDDKNLDPDNVPDEDSIPQNEQGQPPTSDSAEQLQPKLDIETEHTLKETTTATVTSEPKPDMSLDTVEAKQVLSFRGPMGESEPQHGLCTITDHRRNGYVRKGDRGPWIRIDSPKAPALIAGAICETRGVVPRQTDVLEVIAQLKMSVLLAPQTHAVWLRIAALPGGGVEIYVGDLADTRIRVKPRLVEVIQGASSETHFYESPTMAPFVLPAETGDLRLLERYLNLDPTDRGLLIAWITYVIAHPKQHGVAFPILMLGGEHGAGKTFLCHILQALVDPSVLGVQAFPRSERDFAITTQLSSVVFYDNIRAFSRDASDMLCRATSGGMFTIRKLFSDGDVVTLSVHGAFVLNSIHAPIEQPDLAQRTMQLNLLTIDEKNRRSERVMKDEFARDLPAIFRGLLDLVADVLVHLPDVEVVRPERMVDFVHWMGAMERSMGALCEPYQMAYTEALRRGMRGSLEEQPLAAAVMELVDRLDRMEWSGKPADLYDALAKVAGRRAVNSRHWPVNASAMSKQLKTLVPALRRQGIEVHFGRGRARRITITRTERFDHDDEY